MCIPLAVTAALSLGLGVASTVASASAASKNAKSQKQQLAIQADNAAQNSALAKINAEAATKAAEDNATRLLDLTGRNNSELLKLTELNANSRQNITDINVGLVDSISNFNMEIADGQANILLGRGAVQAAAAERSAQIATYNAGRKEDDAQTATAVSNREEQSSRLNYARLKSTQRVSLAANGVVLDEGSALRIQTDTDYFSDVDAQTIHANGVRAAMGYRAEAENFLMEAQDQRLAGDIAKVNALTDAASVRAQAMGAKMASDRDALNMKLSTSFEILQARSNAAAQVANSEAAAEIEAANMRNQGRIEATNYEMQAAGFSAQGAAATAQRNGISPFFEGAAAGISGAASVASKWYGYSKAGVFG